MFRTPSYWCQTRAPRARSRSPEVGHERVGAERLFAGGGPGRGAAEIGVARDLPVQELVEVHGAVAEPGDVEVFGAEAAQHVQGPAGPRHGQGEFGAAALRGKRTEAVERAPVRGAAIARGEDDVVADQALGAFQVHHAEGLVPCREEAGQHRIVGQLQPDGLADPGGVPEAAGHHGQRGPGPEPGVLEDELHRPVDLGHDRFDAVVVGAGQSGAVGQVLHGQGAVQARWRTGLPGAGASPPS